LGGRSIRFILSELKKVFCGKKANARGLGKISGKTLRNAGSEGLRGVFSSVLRIETDCGLDSGL
jgi:hypothetical protein